MVAYTPQFIPSPIRLPEAKSGTMEIRHRHIPVGGKTPVVGMRQAMLRGTHPVQGVVADTPLLVHELREHGESVWMTDLPEELNQIAEMLATVRPHGRIVIGGLGLGLLPLMVRALPRVKTVVVVERSPDVIQLCASYEYITVPGDIAAYLRDARDAADFYLLDTWQGTNEATWWEEVLPLRRIIRQRWGPRPKIHCWAEDIMRGQLQRSLTMVEPHWYYQHLHVPMPPQEAYRFLANVGLPAWEKKYGAAVDRALAEQNDFVYPPQP